MTCLEMSGNGSQTGMRKITIQGQRRETHWDPTRAPNVFAVEALGILGRSMLGVASAIGIHPQAGIRYLDLDWFGSNASILLGQNLYAPIGQTPF